MTATGVVVSDTERYNIITRTSRHAKAGDSSLFLRAIPEGIVGEEIVIDPAGTNPETRTVSAQDDTQITLSSALTYEHEPDVAIIRKDIIADYIVTSSASSHLSANASASDGTVSVTNVPTGLIDKGCYIVIDYQTIECEVIKVSSISGTTITLADNLTYAHASGDPVMFITSEPVSAKWFAALGDNSNADEIPLSRAAIQASRVGKNLHIPSGTYVCDMETVSPIMNITAPIKVYGDGRDNTIIKITPDDTPTGLYEGVTFKVDTDDSKAILSDLTIYGPSTNTGEIRAITIYGGDTTYLADVDIINVLVDNFPSVAIQIGTGRRTVTVDGCILQAYNFILNNSSNPTYDNRLHVYRTWFREGKMTTSLQHFCYLNPGVSWKFEDCIFDTSPATGGYILHGYGNGGQAGGPPYYNEMRNCLFTENCEMAGIIQEHGYCQLKLEGCEFHNGANCIVAGGGMLADGCFFETHGSTAMIRTGENSRFTNCTFFDDDESSGRAVSINKYSAGSSEFIFEGCHFDGATLEFEQTDPGAYFTAIVDSCIFNSSNVSTAYYGIILDNRYVKISSCVFLGNNFTNTIRFQTSPETIEDVEIINCSFLTTAAVSIVNCPDYVARGSGNYFSSTASGIYGSTVKGCFSPLQNIYNTPVASAATVNLYWSYDTYHISGTTTINTLHIVGSTYTIAAHGARIRLIADAAWSLSTAGNIIPLHTGARVANSVTELVYDAANSKWYEISPFVQASEITDELTTITHTAPGTPDYAIQDLTTTTPYGFVTKDEGNTVLSVIANLQARVNELEGVLVAHGLLADAD